MPPPPPPPVGSAEYYLGTPKFTTHQPDVLEQIGAHHAYAMGLTGQGVRIGIDDTIVDYTQTGEFGSRVRLSHADGAVLTYPHRFPRERNQCLSAGTCRSFRGDSEGDAGARNRWVQDIVSRIGWPVRDNSVFLTDDHYSASDSVESLFRWSEVPTPYGVDNDHGTIVASIAAGQNLGVATEAAIIPVAHDFSALAQQTEEYVDAAWRDAIASAPSYIREDVDNSLSVAYREDYAKFDIINRSYGIDEFDPYVISSDIDSELNWYRRYLPKTLDALHQIDTPDSQKTILVYAAGNEGQPWSGIHADWPYYIPELRGYSLSVVATDPQTRRIHVDSNRCGPLPIDWNSNRHGRHYCLAAPGTVRGLVPNPDQPGNGDEEGGLFGTSFAAPLVSGSLALLMEHFRGTRGNTEIVRRMLDTADRTGEYAELETYGAGHLDLEAALSPVGNLNAGQSAHALDRTSLRTPTAFGSLALRTSGIELAAFDDQNFPFWVPLSGLVSAQSVGRSPIPGVFGPGQIGVPATGLDILGLRWESLGNAENFPSSGGNPAWARGQGPASASLARLSQENNWGYGFSLNNAGYLGSETSGAFGSELRSGMIWTSRAFQREVAEGLAVRAEGTLAYSRPQYEGQAIFSASPALMSAMSLRAGTRSTGITLEQPLRAETGTGIFRVENGRITNGRRLYDTYRVPLRPNAREVRATMRHDREAVGGRVAIEIGHAMNAGHVQGSSETSVGIAWHAKW